MTRILIPGIDGFLGRSIAQMLTQDGHEVIGLSNGNGISGLEHHNVDITDRDSVFTVFEKARPKICIHLAALAHADVGPKDQDAVRHVNVDGALNVADAAERSGCEAFIYFSSAKVIAKTTRRDGLEETAIPNPIGIYPRLKREVELNLLERTKSGPLKIAVVRPVAVLGRGDKKGNFAKLIQSVKTGFFPLFNEGKTRRSIVFSNRVAMRIGMMVKKGIINGGVYAFSDGNFETREIVDAIRVVTGFAWCPEIPAGSLECFAPPVDKVLGWFGHDTETAKNILTRLTSSFVIRASKFENDYGPIPEVFDLRRSIEWTVTESH